ncbi:universal stress protein UspA-like protein [Frankia sp. EI5c]|uniref:universal stress protein n=1 Tax=Frankia sp. EI5c TaxID=683316 RepID=UPI0007C34DF0|nr:universal stress protein [Frankia sp. EI5c]OAA25665.1 universal stress protein UspA-like protein [Frankia sp. EI5c]
MAAARTAADTRGLTDQGVTLTEIVVGVNGSAASLPALRWALDEARLHGAGVRAVLASAGPGVPPEVATTTGNPARALLHRAVEEALRGEDQAEPVPITELIVQDHPGHTLVGMSAEARMLVVGAPSHSRHRRVVAGSLAEVCVRAARVPVVVAHDLDLPRPRDPRPVLVGVDGTAPSVAAVRRATREAWLRGVPLVMANARPRWPRVPDSFPRSWQTSRDLRISEEILDYCAAESRQVTTEVSLRPLADDDAAPASLLRLAREAQLLVVGGREGWAGGSWRPGSPARECVIHAPCPVMVVRPG